MRDLEDEARIKAYMAAKMAHIKMYNECMNLADGLDVAKFAELVRADEREACAKVVEDTLEPWLINEYIVRTTEAIQARGNDLQTAIERGTKAWADVPADWVDELRGNDTPEEAPEVTPEVPCKTDPRAPHGFNRNASFDEDRYVCDCEFWEPDVDKVDMLGKRVHKTDKSIHELDLEAPLTVNGVPLYPKKEWVGLTDEEVYDYADKFLYQHGSNYGIKSFGKALEAKLKEKNNG